MSTKTTNYELVKPELSDAADITAMNPNWDKIDTMLKNLANEGWLTPVTKENEDLDNYVTQGIYSFDSAYAPINRPDNNSNGWLIVIPWNNNPGVGTVKQLWLRHGTLNSNDHCLYVRTRISSNNAWSAWAQIYTSKDITANLADLNSLGTTITSINDDIDDLQTEINGKQSAIIGAASTVTSNNLTANRAVISNGSGKIAASSVTSTELGHLSGVTSNVQTQLNDIENTLDKKAPINHASSSDTYGKGTDTDYGHVKLSDSTTSTSGTSGGVAATPAAVKAVHDLANAKQNALTFDDTPTSGSSNPVKSGGVFSALGGKQDALTFDNVPTQNSANPVKSGGVFSALAGKASAEDIGNLWVWGKYAPTDGSYVLRNPGINSIVAMADPSHNPTVWEYSDSIRVAYDGTVIFQNSQTVSISYSNAGVTAASVLAGKFARKDGGESILFFPSDTTFTYYNTSDNRRISTNQYKKVETTVGALALVDYVSSLDSSDYPEDGQSGDYWYTRLGQIGENFGGAKIETGSYVGTGTYGSSNPNELTFSFEPLFVFIAGGGRGALGIKNLDLFTLNSLGGSTYSEVTTWDGRTVRWYYDFSGSPTTCQLNLSDTTYHWIAIG